MSGSSGWSEAPHAATAKAPTMRTSMRIKKRIRYAGLSETSADAVLDLMKPKDRSVPKHRRLHFERSVIGAGIGVFTIVSASEARGYGGNAAINSKMVQYRVP